MGCTVFATTMGFFSKDSGGKSIAPVDICFTPPPPPTGPITVPYVNLTFATDLVDGSRTVKADGQPTAKSNKSKTKKSSGDEAGSQPPKGVASAKNMGEGKFAAWSFTVKIEGEGVDCMGDQVIQNTNGALMNCLDPAAIVQFAAALYKLDMLKPCPEPYKAKKHRPDGDPTLEQIDAVDGKPCWECQRDSGSSTPIPAVWNTAKDPATGKIAEDPSRNKQARTTKKRGEAMTHDHQPPLAIAWEMGGCHMGEKNFKALFDKKEMVKPHCRAHYRTQGTQLSAQSSRLRP